MALTNRFTAIDKAMMTSCGNTLVVCGSTTATNNNTSSMIKTDGTTTRDWQQAGATAALSIPADSTILFASLSWYSTVNSTASGATDVQSIQDNAITFVTPSGTNQITPTITESLTTNAGNIDRFRSAVVTSIIQQSLSGNYTVSGVPTSIPPTGLSSVRAGWVLTVAFRNATLPPKKISLSTGISNALSTSPLQTIITGFATPNTDVGLGANLCMTAANGAPLLTGDQVSVGPSFASLSLQGNPVTSPNPNPGTAPNNPINGFFGGQINVCNPLSVNNGLININGTNGSNNNDSFVPSQVVGARNKWDLTNINISNSLIANQNQLAIQVTNSNSDEGIMILSVGTSVKADAPDITTTFSAFDPDGHSSTVVEVGEIVVYKLQIRNSGTLPATNVIVSSALDPSETFVANSIKVNGTTVTGNISTGVNIGTINPTGVANVSFEVVVNSVPSNPGRLLYTDMNYQYSFVSGSGSPTTTNTGTTNIIELEVINPNFTMTKTASSLNAAVGDTVTFTSVIQNVGSQDGSNTFFQDKISNYASFVTGSVQIDGVSQPTLDPNTGFTLGFMAAAGSTQRTVTFDVTITSIPPSKTITNTSEFAFSYTTYHPTPIYTKTIFSNVVTIQALYTNIVAERCTNDDYPAVGDVITYTLSLTNTGNTTATNVQVQEPAVFGQTFVTGSVTVGGTPQPTYNPFTGFTIPSIPAGQTVEVTYEMLVNTVDPNRLVQNIANVPFQYQISPTSPIVTGEVDSNIVKTLTSFVDVTLFETVDKAYAIIGDKLYYTVTITNTGNVDAINTIFQSIIQPGSTFIANTVAINGVIQSGANPNTGFSIGTLCYGDTITVTYQALVTAVPTGNIIPNTSTLTYDYSVDPNNTTLVTETATSNTVQTIITKLDFTFVKSVDKEYAQVGDALVYTMIITNTGNVDLTDVIFYDYLSPYLTLVPGQVFVDGVQRPTENPYTGIAIGTITPGSNVRVSLGATINTLPPAGFVTNTADMIYTYRLNPNSEIITQSAKSNEVRTFVTDGNLSITKAVDKSVAKIGDTLTYSFNISNIGNVTATNLSFIDLIPTGTTFVTGSVLENGVSQPSFNPVTGFPLIDLAVGEVVTVSFNVTVTSIPTPNTLINNGSVTFNYVVNPNTVPLIKTVTSNNVITTVNFSSTTLTKAVDKAFASINNILNYTLVLTNTGSVNITNVSFTDIIPTGANFQAGTVKIDGVTQASFNPNLGFPLSNLSPGSSTTIQFQAKVTSIPTPNTIINTGTVNYSYQLTPISPIVPTSVTSNAVTTTVTDATSALVKSVDKLYATIGDTVTYTAVFSNFGNVPFTNVTFVDTLPGKLGGFNWMSVVPGSVTINGTSFPELDPTVRFPLPNISAGGSVTVTFKATINELNSLGYVDNRCRVEYSYELVPGTSIRNGRNSNYARTYIRVGSLTITKTADRQFAVLTSVVNYTFVIKNSGNTTLVNETFIDAIQSDSTFNAGSVVVNGVSQPSYNPNVGFALPDLPAGKGTTINFSVTVNTIPADGGQLKNTGTTSYSYYVDPQGVPLTGTQTSNQTIVLIRDTIINPTKSRDLAIGKIGDDILYSFTIANIGNVAATNVLFTDILSTNLSFVAGTVFVNGTPEPTFNPNSGFSIPNIDAGSSATVSFVATIISRPPGNIIYNFATIDYQYQPIPTEPPITAQITTNTVETAVATGEITVSKAVDKQFATIGDELNYTITVTNTGSVDIFDLDLTDLIPTGSQFNSSSVIVNGVAQPTYDPNNGFVIPDLLPGQTNSITFVTTVTALPASGKLDNFATIGFSYRLIPTDPIVTTNINTNTVTTFVNIGILNVTKAVNKAYATINDVLTYSFTIPNTGTVACTGIKFQDVIQSQATFNTGSVIVNGTSEPSFNPNIGFAIPDIAAGANATVSFTVTVNSRPANGLILNSANVDYNYRVTPTSELINQTIISNIVQTIINIGSLTLTKFVNLAYATINDTIIYTVDVLNNGSVDATNINFRDIIPTGLTFIPGSVTIGGIAQPGLNPFDSFTLGTLTPGAQTTVVFRATVTSVPNPSLVSNTATSTFSYKIDPAGPTTTTEVTSNTVTTQINIGQLAVTKAVDKLYATLGDVLTYSFVITNTGNVTATNVSFMDNLQPGITFNSGSVIVNGTTQPTYNPESSFPIGTINALGTATVSFTVTVTSIPASASVTNFCMVEFNYKIDPAGQTFSATATSNTVVTILRRATISAVKSVDKAYATLQEQLLYTIAVTNTGNAALFQLNFTDVLSAGGTFNPGSVVVGGISQPTYNPITGFPLPNLPSGDSVIVQFFAVVTSVPTPPVIENFATVTGKYKVDPAGPDLDVSTTSNTVQTQINVGNLSIVKAVDKQYAKVLDTLTYTNVITNTGNVNATNVTFSDNLQSQISFTAGTVRINGITNPALNPTTGFNLGTLTPGQSVTVEFDVKVNTLPVPNVVNNTSQAVFSYLVNPAGPTITETKTSNQVTTIIVVGNLTPVKAVDKSIATLNDILTYTITITNDGNVLASNVFFQDTPSTGATFLAGSVLVNGVSEPTFNPIVGFSLGNISVGTVVTVQFQATVTSVPPSNQITNQATINFQYVVDPKDPPVTATVTSNIVTTNVALGNLSVVKSVNKAYATIGDELTYTVVVTNIGNINATNVQFLDATPANSAFVIGSVTVNGTPQPTYNPSVGFNIGTLTPGQIVTVVYKVVVTSGVA